MRPFRLFVFLIFVVSLGLMAASFAGWWFAFGDSLAVLRYWISVVTLVAMVLLVRRRRRPLAALILIFGLTAGAAGVWVQDRLQPAPGGYALYQKNMLRNNAAQETLVAEILSADADFVTVQELGPHTLPAFRTLAAHYPTSVECFGAGGNRASVLAKWPQVPDSALCRADLGLSAVRVTTPAGEITVASLHLPWPWPYPQKARLDQVLPVLRTLAAPVVLAGDFNMVPWSAAVGQVEDATGTRRLGPFFRTYIGHNGMLRLPIDHVLVPGEQGHLQLRPLAGSDHHGLLARFDF